MKKRILSLVLALALVMSLLPFAVAADSTQFTDVDKNGWYKSYVDDVVSKGYFKGTSATTFEPETYMTRAMFVTVLARLDGAKVDDSKSVFTDVPADAWYTGSVTWAAKNNIVNGIGDGKFAPNDLITREQMCTIMDRYLTYYAKAHNVTVNSSKNTVTFSDQNAISSWAVAAVASCVSYGLIIGTGDGSFQPARTATRAEVATVISRLAVTANAISGGSHGGSSTKTDDTNKADDVIGEAVKQTMIDFRADFAKANALVGNKLGVDAYYKNDVDATGARPQTITLDEIDLSDDILATVIVDVSALVIDLIDEGYSAVSKEEVGAIVDAIVDEVEAALNIDLTASTTVEEIKTAVYNKVAPKAKSYWNNFSGCVSKATVSAGSYSFDVVFDESNHIQINSADMSKLGKAKFAAKFAAAIAKDVYGDLQSYTAYTGELELAATVNVKFVPSAAYAAVYTGENAYPVVYPVTAAFAVDAGENVQYKYNGASYIKLGVSDDAQDAYETAINEVIDALLATDTVRAKLDAYVDASIDASALAAQIAGAVIADGNTVVDLLEQTGKTNAEANSMVATAVTSWLDDNDLVGILIKKYWNNESVTFENQAFHDLIMPYVNQIAAAFPNTAAALKVEAFAKIDELVETEITNAIESSSYKAYLDKALNLTDIDNVKLIKLGNLATLLKKPTFQSYVGSYGNSTIAKVTDYIAKLPAGADVTVKVGGQTLKIDKTKLAALQASTGTVDACNALADIVDDLSNVSLSSFDTNEGAYITATAKGRTYGFHLVICFDSNHIH